MSTEKSDNAVSNESADVHVRNTECLLEDYALIGDCHAAALVSKRGSIDWLCLPTFSSAAIFCALLDERCGGKWSLSPKQEFTSTQKYVDGTNVIQTCFNTTTGVVVVTDLFVADIPTNEELEAEREILRITECVSGEVQMEMHFEPRMQYGRHALRMRRSGKFGWQCLGHGMDAILQTEFDVTSNNNEVVLTANKTLREGECAITSWAYANREVCVVPALLKSQSRRDATIAWWRKWLAQGTYAGKFSSALQRSALTLKLMTSALTGGVIAAPTTSIPERLGSSRNWDYRYCWIRDSAFAMRAFMDLGYAAEGTAFQHWLLRAVRLPWSKLQVMYDLWGNTRLKEKTLNHLQGFCGAQPVHIGNGASEQFQSDLYGELIAATADFVARGGKLEQDEKRLLKDLGERVCKLWRQPDQGIWEKRTPPRHYTFSKVMCWVAIEQLLKIEEHVSLNLEREVLIAEQRVLRQQIEQRGFNRELNSYVEYFDGQTIDASLLLLAKYLYVVPNDPKMRGTFDRIDRELTQGALVWRYCDDDGVLGPENSFLPCVFWAVEYLALAGDLKQAEQRLELLLECATETNLLSEEFSAERHHLTGNFPQALTHESLIGAVLTLQRKVSEHHE